MLDSKTPNHLTIQQKANMHAISPTFRDFTSILPLNSQPDTELAFRAKPSSKGHGPSNRTRSFATVFFALPRELRDHIYGYIFEDAAGQSFMRSYITQVSLAETPYAVNLCIVNFPLPPYADAENVGPVMAAEILEWAYSNLFRKCIIHPSNIPYFLRPKLPGLDVSVAHYVKKIEIEWENRDAGSGLLFARGIPESKLEALDLLCHNKGVVVDNLIRCAFLEDANGVGSFMEKFRSIYEHLKDCGITMRFKAEERLEPFKYFTEPDEWEAHYEAMKKKERDDVAAFLKAGEEDGWGC